MSAERAPKQQLVLHRNQSTLGFVRKDSLEDLDAVNS